MRKPYNSFSWYMRLLICMVPLQVVTLPCVANLLSEPAHSSNVVRVSNHDSLHARSSGERESGDSVVGVYHVYLLPLDLIRTEFALLEIGGDMRIGSFVTLGASFAYSLRSTADDDVMRAIVNTDVYLSGDAYTSSLLVSPFISLRRLRSANYASYVIPERFVAGIGSFIGYRHFYTLASQDKISLSLMLGISMGRQLDGFEVRKNELFLNTYFRIGLGYVFAKGTR